MRVFFNSLALFLILSFSAAAGNKITGKITEKTSEGKPLPGVTVILDGTGKGTTSDNDGNYSIDAEEGDVLVFSCIGYKEVREVVSGQKTINVRMSEEMSSLEEAVVIGYGTQAKSDLTGAVAVVDMKDINIPSTTSADQSLQGRIAGVDIVSSGGEPGAGSSIRIRGTRSISAGNEPLIVVDGVINAVESFSDINPDDIKNITVLKDASSTAIYGARGSNGVILVTTKSNDHSKLRLIFDCTLGVSMLAKKLDVFDASQFAQWRNDYNSNYTNPEAGKPTFENPSAFGKGTDWQDVLTQTAFQQTYRIQAGMGDKKHNAYFSIAYDDKPGIVLGTGLKRVTSMFKYDNMMTKWAKIGIKVNYTFRHNDVNKIAINGTSSTSAVCLSPLVGKEDIWNRYSDTADSSSSIFDSPYLKATRETNYKVSNYLNIVPWVELTLARGLKLASTYSMLINSVEAFFYSPSTMALAQYRKTGGTASFTDNKKTNHLSETTLTWDKEYGKKHKLNLMAGFTAERSTLAYNYIKGTGYADDSVGPYNLGAVADKRNLTVDSSRTIMTRMSALARLNYSYKSRYFITLTARGDGSSVFSDNNKWAFFPAAAFKWTISNETWMARAKTRGVSSLSLRISVGRNGNDAVSSYMSQNAIATGGGSWLFGDNTRMIAYPARLGNPGLTWEKTDSYNVGIDLSLLKNRVTMSFEGYQCWTKDLLLLVQNAQQTGFSDRYANIGNTKGWGLEYSLDSRNIVRRNFTWIMNFTISHSSSYVTDIGAGYEYVPTYSKGTQMVYGYKKGYSTNALWGYQYCGVWHNDEELAENDITKAYVSYSKQKGWPKYADINHDGVLDKNDCVYLGTSDPVVYGGLNNNFKIFDFNLGIYLTYSLGGKIYNISEFKLGTGDTSSNKYSYMTDAWHPVRNPDSDLPSAKTSDTFASSRFVHDSSYLRLKSLSLSYVLKLSEKVRWMRDITFGVCFDNLFLITSYNGFDPDVSSSKYVQRLDNATYPAPRTYSFNIKIRY